MGITLDSFPCKLPCLVGGASEACCKPQRDSWSQCELLVEAAICPRGFSPWRDPLEEPISEGSTKLSRLILKSLLLRQISSSREEVRSSLGGLRGGFGVNDLSSVWAWNPSRWLSKALLKKEAWISCWCLERKSTLSPASCLAARAASLGGMFCGTLSSGFGVCSIVP